MVHADGVKFLGEVVGHVNRVVVVGGQVEAKTVAFAHGFYGGEVSSGVTVPIAWRNLILDDVSLAHLRCSFVVTHDPVLEIRAWLRGEKYMAAYGAGIVGGAGGI